MRSEKKDFLRTLFFVLEFSTIPLTLYAFRAFGDSGTPKPTHSPRSTDWKRFPKQSWELTVDLPQNPNPLKSLEDDAKVKSRTRLGFDAHLFPSSDKIDPLAHIIGSTTEGSFLGLYDTVFIEANEPLKTDAIYAVTSQPETLKSPKSGRKVFSYFIQGKIQILGMRDKLYIGRIIANSDLIARGSSLIPLPPKVSELAPIAGPKPVEAIVVIDHRMSTYATAQHKEVFIDKGSEDGIKPGMYFRAYQYYDPKNKKRLTETNLAIIADLLVTQVSSKFSTAIITHSRTTLTDFSKVILLTDVADLKKYPEFNFKRQGDDFDLDSLDDGLRIKEEEKKKLNQLEKWKKNPAQLPTPTPSATSTEASPDPILDSPQAPAPDTLVPTKPTNTVDPMSELNAGDPLASPPASAPTTPPEKVDHAEHSEAPVEAPLSPPGQSDPLLDSALTNDPTEIPDHTPDQLPSP